MAWSRLERNNVLGTFQRALWHALPDLALPLRPPPWLPSAGSTCNPMPEWTAIENRLLALPVMDPARRKFLDRTNYYGQEAEMDTQGRVLIPYQLRSKAEMLGDVAVLGYLNYLEVWSLERFEARLAADPFTDDDAAALARLGI